MTVYDFDNTIYDGESGFDIFMFYLKKDPLTITKFIPKFGECFIKYKTGKISADSVVDEYGDLLKSYCVQIDDIERDVQEFWDENEKKIKSFYAKIHTEDDVIVSACPEFLLSEICRRIGVKHYIGSLIDPKTGEIERVCYKQNKIKAFYGVYGEIRIDDFYTDSMSDKPMMDISENVYFVTGDRIEKIKAGNQWLIDLKK